MSKQFMQLIALCSALIPTVADARERSCGRRCRPIPITQRDIPLTINDPGVYQVCSDIFWNPTSSNQTAITINVPDVTIDFDKHTLNQADHSKANCIGVLVNPKLYNIQLVNGTIEDITMWGVVVLGGNSDVSLDGLNVLSCGRNGSDIWTPYASGGLGVFNKWADGAPGDSVGNLFISNCNFNDSFSALVGVKAAWIAGAEGIVIENCNFNNTTCNAPSGLLNALVLFECTAGRIENCNFNNSIGLAGAAVAWPVFIYHSYDISLLNCQVLNTQSLGGNNSIYGIYIDGGQSFVLDGCIIQDFYGVSDTNVVSGYTFVSCEDVAVRNCVAQGISGDNAGVLGYIGNYIKGFTFENCIAVDIENASSGGSFQSVAGFGFFFGNEDVMMRNCTAMGIDTNQTTSSPYTYCTGFGLFSEGYDSNANIVIRDSLAQDVTAPADFPADVYGVGFYADGTGNMEISNCVSQGNVTGYSLNSVGGFPANSCTVQNNFAANNSAAGFMDNSGAPTNIFIGNRGFLNNGNNFSGLSTSAGIRTWDYTTPGTPPPATNNWSVATAELVDNWSIN